MNVAEPSPNQSSSLAYKMKYPLCGYLESHSCATHTIDADAQHFDLYADIPEGKTTFFILYDKKYHS